jgi:hypothetical protein
LEQQGAENRRRAAERNRERRHHGGIFSNRSADATVHDRAQ